MPWIVAGLIGLLSTTALAQDDGRMEVTEYPKLPKKPELGINVLPYELTTSVFTFPSGLRVMFQADNTMPVVAVTTVYDYGSADDPVGMEGMAHLYEHMWFQTKHGELPQTWGLLTEELGCDINAYTNNDRTVYMTVCPSDQFEALLRLEPLRTMAPMDGVAPEEVTSEIEVVRNEIRMRSENGNIPFFPLITPLNQHVFADGHPYSRPIAGDHTSIRSIQHQDVVDWSTKHYRADSQTMMIVGDFEQERGMDYIVRSFPLEMLHPDLTDEHLFRYPRPGVEEPDNDNPEHWWLGAFDPDTFQAGGSNNQILMPTTELQPRRDAYAGIEVPLPANMDFKVYEATVDDPTVIVAWTAPPAYQGQDNVMNLTSNVLTFFMSALEDDDLNVKSFDGCGPFANKQGSIILCAATLKSSEDKKQPHKSAERMLDYVYNLWSPDLQRALEAQLTRGRMENMASIFRNLDLYAAVGGGRATDIAVYAHYTGDPMYHSNMINDVMTMTGPAVTDFAQTWLTRERATSLMVIPVSRDDVLDVSMDGAEHYGDGTTKAEYGLVQAEDITPDLVRSVYQAPSLDKMEESSLPNGMRLVSVEHSEAPIAKVTLIVNGGSANDHDGTLSAARAFTMMEIEDALPVAGAWGGGTSQGGQNGQIRLGALGVMGETYQTVTLEGSAGNLDGLLWMMRDAMESMRPDLDGKGDYVRDRLDDRESNLYDVDWWIGNLTMDHLNPGHPYTQTTGRMTMEELRAFWGGVDRATVKAHIDNVWQPSNATLLIVGNVDNAESLALAAQYWGGWETGNGNPQIPEYLPPHQPKGRQVMVFDNPGKTQTRVQLRCQIPDPEVRPDPNYPTLGMVIRQTLFSRLRENSGVVYSPGAYVSEDRELPQLILSADVQNPAVAYTLETYDDVLRQLEEGSFNEAHIKQAKYTASWKSVLQWQSVDQIGGMYQSLIGQGYSWSVWDDYSKRLSELDPAGLSAAVGDCRENAFVYFHGPIDVISPYLDEAGIEYEIYDWKAEADTMLQTESMRRFKKRQRKKARADKKKARKEAKEGKESAEPADDAASE